MSRYRDALKQRLLTSQPKAALPWEAWCSLRWRYSSLTAFPSAEELISFLHDRKAEVKAKNRIFRALLEESRELPYYCFHLEPAYLNICSSDHMFK